MSIQLDINPLMTVLVVDDHILTRDMVRMILRSIGFAKIQQAESGEGALKILNEQNIDLIVCDWNMPNGSGIELLRQIRADAKLEHIPFLMLTAEAYRENIVAAVKAGVTDYVAKPFTADTLAEKIAGILKTGRK